MVDAMPHLRTEPTETLLVTGFLGTGKTTLLRGWLAQRPPGERWAVLVNEFGALGVDRALLGGDAVGSDTGEVAVAEVAGGCACCAAQVAFGATLTRLLRRGPWHRLFVETTGLGHPARLVDQLRASAFAGRLRVLPPVAVVDATRAALYGDAAHPGHAIAADQLALARLVVLNRIGEVSPDMARDLAERLAGSPPWRRPVLPTVDGVVALQRVLVALDGAGPASDRSAAVAGSLSTGSPSSGRDAAAGRAEAGTPAAPGARDASATDEVSSTRDASATDEVSSTRDASSAGKASSTGEASGPGDPAPLRDPPPAADPRSGSDPPGPLPEPMRWQRTDADAAAAGWWWPADAAFDRAALAAALDALVAPGGPLQACGLLRGKGVFRTARAWYAWQWVDGRSHWAETAWRADNRLEVLAQRVIDPQVVDVALRAAAPQG
jgi:G3E family GTPase